MCMCEWVFSRSRDHIFLPLHSQQSALFNTYTRNSIFARALPLALICSSLSICLRLSWEILILCQLHGNEYFFFFFFFDIFSPRQNCFSLPTPFCFSFPSSLSWRPTRPLFSFSSSHFILVLLFWGSSNLDGCASSCRIPGMFFCCFFLEELEGKGEGAQNLALIP